MGLLSSLLFFLNLDLGLDSPESIPEPSSLKISTMNLVYPTPVARWLLARPVT